MQNIHITIANSLWITKNTLYLRKINFSSSPVFLKVSGIAPLGAILNGKGTKNPKGATGGRNNRKGAKMLNP